MFARELFDRGAALIGLLLLAPLLALIAIGIRRDSPGPAFFLQERIGLRGQPFRMVKFRSMHVDAPTLGGPLTVGEDPRVTRAGRWLRSSRLDELPQLWNVVRGDMALVGPRPEVGRFVARYTAEQRRVLEVKPGITDPASLANLDESALLAKAADPEAYYIERLLPEKLRLCLEYEAQRTFFSDLGIILRTLARLATRGRDQR